MQACILSTQYTGSIFFLFVTKRKIDHHLLFLRSWARVEITKLALSFNSFLSTHHTDVTPRCDCAKCVANLYLVGEFIDIVKYTNKFYMF